MKLNRFNIKIIIYSLLIAFTGFMAFRSLFTDHLLVTKITWILVWALLIFLLIRMLNRTNRNLDNFLQSLLYMDNINEIDDGDTSFRDLNLTLNHIINNIKEARKDREAQGHYFKNTVENVNVGLISYNTEGKIKMVNRAARELLKFRSLTNMEQFNDIKKGLKNEMDELKPGEDRMLSLVIEKELMRIAVKKARIRVLDEDLSILSLQNIRPQLEEEEVETWQKLISILRHEIMNSSAPINSLSKSLLKMTNKPGPWDEKQNRMIREGLDAISTRTSGMMDFVDAYRNLTSIPEPVFSRFRISEILDDIKHLYKAVLEERKILLRINNRDDPEIIADPNLITQVLLNLLKNSIQAVTPGEGIIEIDVTGPDEGFTRITLKDNGTGIPGEEIDKIFIPFYTTREEGSGIGLSLARQILKLHKGHISVKSSPGNTEFEIKI